ncbi:hypothetical protein OBBRIDRAFT_594610 [Obba rivulosa]|uniref:Uncharacterized protein n=1 Tax=Obba rivulosa TaxID=1052685 RepID=A0A8E2ATB0_9APHY|nr:hypothetical protein OBBRIDRAFT_594610 [Obba rivulosa]
MHSAGGGYRAAFRGLSASSLCLCTFTFPRGLAQHRIIGSLQHRAKTQWTLASALRSLHPTPPSHPQVEDRPAVSGKGAPQRLITSSDAVDAVISIINVARFSKPGKAQAKELIALIKDDPDGDDLLVWITNHSRRRSLVVRMLDDRLAQPVLALHLLYMADRLANDTDDDLYHFITFNFVWRRRWAWIPGLIQVQIELTGRTTVEMLNWLIISFIRRKERKAPNEILQLFHDAGLKPTPRTHKLLAELSKIPHNGESPSTDDVQLENTMSYRDMSWILLQNIPKPAPKVDEIALKKHADTVKTIQVHFRSLHYLMDQIKHHDSPERYDPQADASLISRHYKLRMFRLNLYSLLHLIEEFETKNSAHSSKPRKRSDGESSHTRKTEAGERNGYASTILGDVRSTLKLMGDLVELLKEHDAKYAPLEEDLQAFYRRVQLLQTKQSKHPDSPRASEKARGARSEGSVNPEQSPPSPVRQVHPSGASKSGFGLEQL